MVNLTGKRHFSLLQLLVAIPQQNSLNFVSTLTTKAVTAEADTVETERGYAGK